MKRRLPKSNGVYIEKHLLQSDAFWDLTSSALKVFMVFMLKRKLGKNKSSKNGSYNIVNNGNIQFTYIEAEDKCKIPKSTFLRAIDKLIELGFIEITEHGGEHHPNKYFISNNWMNYPDKTFKRKKSNNLVGKKTRWKKDTLKNDTIKSKDTLKNDTIK